MSDANNRQVGGLHYKAQYQHWDFVRLCLDGRYLEGCLTKYVSRWRKKNGLQDLEKALHYTEKLMEGYTKGHILPLIAGPWRGPETSPSRFADVNGLDILEREIILKASSWATFEDLQDIHLRIRRLLDDEHARIDRMRDPEVSPVFPLGEGPTPSGYVNQG